MEGETTFMNAASRWRRKLATRIAPIYAANPHVVAVLLGGSAARGHSDRYSDIELGLFWRHPPTDAERRAAIAEIGGDLIALYPFDAQEQVWCDDLMLGRRAPGSSHSGVLVELVHYTQATVERTLNAMLEQHDPDELKQNLLAGIVDGLPLHNASLIQRWQRRAADYPEELAVAVVRRHAQIDHFWRWRLWLDRGSNLTMLYASYVQIQQKLLHVLLGLNRVYYFGFKWLDAVVARLSIAPPDLLQRLGSVYQAPPDKGAIQLASLVEDTYTLVEQHLPQVDVARLRDVFRYERPLWDGPPPM
jgi:hypothetical protein